MGIRFRGLARRKDKTSCEEDETTVAVEDSSNNTSSVDARDSLNDSCSDSHLEVKDTTTTEHNEDAVNKNNPRNRRVSFSTLELHSHELVLGDNPSTMVGPPLSIGWKKLHTDTVSVDDFEHHRGERRERASLVMPCIDRERELLFWGYSRSEMRLIQDELEMIKTSRARNAHMTLREWISSKISSLRNC